MGFSPQEGRSGLLLPPVVAPGFGFVPRPLPRTAVWLPLPPSLYFYCRPPPPMDRNISNPLPPPDLGYIYPPPSIPSPSSPPRRRTLSRLFRPVLPPRLEARSRCGVARGS